MDILTWPNASMFSKENQSQLQDWFKEYAKMGTSKKEIYERQGWNDYIEEDSYFVDDSKINNDPSWVGG